MLKSYFDLLETTIRESDLAERPCQIFNLDESGFPLSTKPPKIVTRKGERHPIAVTGIDKGQITVLACCSAGGYSIPPLVIFDRKSLKPEMTLGEVPGTMYGLSNSGWMDTELFETWFTNHFLAYIPPIRLVILLMDGHSSHFGPFFVNQAAEEKVIVFCLPPHSTHRTQPLDKGVFGPLKRAWREECHEYLSNNPGKVITRYQFSYLFGRTWKKGMIPHNIMKGFEVTGIYPVNRYKVLPEKSPLRPSLSERTGLRFIPLFTPHSFTPSRRIPLPSDNDHNNSLSELPNYSDDDSVDSLPPPVEPPEVPEPQRETLFTKVLRAQSMPPAISAPQVSLKSSARVLTSEQCRKEINEKHQKKVEALQQKEERRLECEKKRVEKEKRLEEAKALRESRSKDKEIIIVIINSSFRRRQRKWSRKRKRSR